MKLKNERAKSRDIDERDLVVKSLEISSRTWKRSTTMASGRMQSSRECWLIAGPAPGRKCPLISMRLRDEYLRLSYHGLRAKDNSFNADYKTDFDPNLPKVNVVPQDIGRVLLNIINNAFQAYPPTLQGFRTLGGVLNL
jgi:two-component system, NtrC family, sensor kinase